jgi:hypothetical protein
MWKNGGPDIFETTKKKEFEKELLLLETTETKVVKQVNI